MRLRDRLKRAWGMFGIALLASVMLLGGCEKAGPARAEGENLTADYSYGQLMVVAATERNRYQNVYTDKLWSVQLDEAGGTFETRLKEQIESFLVELDTVNRMAAEEGLEPDGQEKQAIAELAKGYYDSLSTGDKAYMKVSEDEIQDLYTRYYLADKLVTRLTENENLEVSDAEAKVIKIQRIVLDTREEAEAALEQVTQEKADFSALAPKLSKEDQTEFSLEWQENMGVLEQSAFALEQDEISGILEENGKFYIQKCVNAYDREATAERKRNLIREKKSKAFKAIYEPYAREHKVALKAGIWDKVDFSAGEECPSDDFFQRYHSADSLKR